MLLGVGVHMSAVCIEATRGRRILWSWSYSRVWATMWALGIKLRASQEQLVLTAELSLFSPPPCLPCSDRQLSLFTCMITVLCVSELQLSPLCLSGVVWPSHHPRMRPRTTEVMWTSGKSSPVSVLTSYLWCWVCCSQGEVDLVPWLRSLGTLIS